MTSRTAVRSSSRPARAAAATSCGALLLALTSAGTASAQDAATTAVSAATTSGVVQVVLTLPQDVPGLPNPVELTLLGTDGTLEGDQAETNSYLAGGSLVTDSPLAPVFAPLSRTLTATTADPGPKSETGIAVPDNPLQLQLEAGSQTAAVTAATGASTATSELADASLASLSALGLDPVLDPLLGGVNTALTTLVAAAQPLTGAVGGLPSLPSVPVPNPLAPVVGGPATIPTPTLGGPALAGTINELPARVEALLDQLQNGALVELSGLDTSQAVTPAAGGGTATASAQLLTAELFGGLVSVEATEAVATAKAGLTRAAADADASATLVEVTIADSFGELLMAVASDQGITAGLLDGSLGQTLDPTVRPTVEAVDTALNALLAQLTGLLEALGGGADLIQQGTVTETVSADGRSAEALASPAVVQLGLPVAVNLVELQIGAAAAAVEVAQVAAPVQPVVPVEPVPDTLPRTGAAALAPLAGLGLLGTAALLYRRRRTA